MNEVLRTIAARRSVRQFSDRQVPEECLKAIVNAGNCAPYAQPEGRYFTVVEKKEMLDTLNDAAKVAAGQMDIPHLAMLGKDEDFHCLYHAPVALIVCGNEETVAPESDCAAAVENMLLAAQSLGLASCWIFFATLAFLLPEGEELKKQLQIPSGYRPIAFIALGYGADDGSAPQKRLPAPVTYIR